MSAQVIRSATITLSIAKHGQLIMILLLQLVVVVARVAAVKCVLFLSSL